MNIAPKKVPLPIPELEETLARLTAQASVVPLTAPKRKALEAEIRGVIEQLSQLLGTL